LSSVEPRRFCLSPSLSLVQQSLPGLVPGVAKATFLVGPTPSRTGRIYPGHILQMIESENGLGWKGTSKLIWFQPACHDQGHLTPAQGAQSSIQPGLEHCQGGGSRKRSDRCPLPREPALPSNLRLTFMRSKTGGASHSHPSNGGCQRGAAHAGEQDRPTALHADLVGGHFSNHTETTGP